MHLSQDTKQVIYYVAVCLIAGGVLLVVWFAAAIKEAARGEW